MSETVSTSTPTSTPWIAPDSATLTKLLSRQRYVGFFIAIIAFIFVILGLVSAAFSQQIQNPTATPQCLSSTNVTALVNIGISAGVCAGVLFLAIFFQIYTNHVATGRWYSLDIIILVIGALALLASSIMIAVVAQRITPASTTQCMGPSDLQTLKAASAINIIVGVVFMFTTVYQEGFLCGTS